MLKATILGLLALMTIVSTATSSNPISWGLRDYNNLGGSNYSFPYGASGSTPVTGHWDGSKSQLF